LRSQKTIEESRDSRGGAAAMGVPGLASNTPGTNPAVAPDGSVATPQPPRETANRRENVNNYEISTTIEHRIVPFGAVKRLSVAVVVGGKPGKAEASGFTPRDEQELAAIRKLVERAIGFDEDRGDAVDVRSMPLMDIGSPADAEALAAAERKAFWLQMARYGLAALALMMLALFVLRPLAARLRESARATEPETGSGGELPRLSADAFERLASLEQVRQRVASDPDRASRVLREWVDPA
ncbi:MAG: flagellar M-ring protein FliF C-terminal domain-containing protein, partial [Mariprofundaceae bacterium]